MGIGPITPPERPAPAPFCAASRRESWIDLCADVSTGNCRSCFGCGVSGVCSRNPGWGVRLSAPANLVAAWAALLAAAVSARLAILSVFRAPAWVALESAAELAALPAQNPGIDMHRGLALDRPRIGLWNFQTHPAATTG